MLGNIVVTGGAGYVGSHVCKALSSAGFSPVAYDNLSRGNREAVKWGPLEERDLGNPAHIREVLAKYEPLAVIHMAAYAYVGESVTRPDLYYKNNLIGTLSLVDAMVATGVNNLVFSSTCSVYGSPSQSPIDEQVPLMPENPYGASKSMAEQILSDYGRSHGLSFLCLRYFNAAGADPDLEIGEDHGPETHLIPRAILATIDDGDVLEIFGTDYDTPDGTAVRDYVHVGDLAAGHLAAMAYLQGGGASTALNLGNESGYSVREIVAAVEAVTGRKVPIREAARRPGDPPILVANSSKAKKLIGWNTRYSDIETIISTAAKWHFSRSESLKAS